MIADENGNEMACIICPIADYGYANCDMKCNECEYFLDYKETVERGNKNE